MPIRYTDLDITANGAKDFVVRQRTPTITQLVLLCLSGLFLCIGASVLFANRATIIVVVFSLLSSAGWYVIGQIQRNRDLLLATEFQNSLFASALGINNKFCLIIKRDGNIVYIDRSFQELFPDFLKQSHRSIDVLLYQGKVTREESEKIYQAIGRGVYDKVIFAIRGSDGQMNKIVMSVEPILRPSGFILLRGREFIEQRAAEDQPDGFKSVELMNKSNITLFSYVMDSMGMGVYMTGPGGNIVYASPVLEHWLDFQIGEITSENLSLQDIIYSGGERQETIEPDNFEGEVKLQKKTGSVVKTFINQKVIRDDQSKVLGCTALVHNLIHNNSTMQADGKKKLW